ncbi:MAG: ATP-binding protein [Planctomycetota bacterium]
MVLTLTVEEGPDAGTVFQVPMNEPQLIGRSSEALPISDTTVSRRHAELTPDEGRWYISDLRSQNHTYVNGRRIAGRIELQLGDEIRVGSTVFRVGEASKADGLADVIQLVDDERMENVVERRLASNEDSVILADPEPSRAAAEHLRVIYRLVQLTAQLSNQQQILEGVMEMVFNELGPERGVVVLVGEPAPERKRPAPRSMFEAELIPEGEDIPLVGPPPGPELIPVVVKYANPPADDDEAKIQVSETIMQTAIRESQGILSSNAQSDPRFSSGDSVTRYNIRSAICAPIKFGDQTFGAIYIDSSIANYTFTAEQLALMNAIGQHSALAIANAEQTAKRLQGERLAAIGETVASLAHSVKNIIQGLRGGADVVEMGMEKEDLKIAQGGWDILKRNLDRIVALSMNMLAFSRPRQLDLEVVKIGSLLADCQQILEPIVTERDLVLIVDVDPEMPPIPLDTHLMHQALMNVLTNAIEAVEDGTGVVSVRVFFHEPGPDKPKLTAPLTEIVIVDNGPGIERDKLGWIFEPFHTTKGIRGTGLGLAVTKRIVNDHRGRIRVESRPGKGTLFRLIIPADLDVEVDPSETAASRTGTGAMKPIRPAGL